jgi:predicted transcriptional regulator
VSGNWYAIADDGLYATLEPDGPRSDYEVKWSDTPVRSRFTSLDKAKTRVETAYELRAESTLDESRERAHGDLMTSNSTTPADPDAEHWDFPAASVTATLTPEQHCAEMAVLSTVLRWVAVVDEITAGGGDLARRARDLAEIDMHRLGTELKALYERDKF